MAGDDCPDAYATRPSYVYTYIDAYICLGGLTNQETMKLLAPAKDFARQALELFCKASFTLVGNYAAVPVADNGSCV